MEKRWISLLAENEVGVLGRHYRPVFREIL